MMGIVLSRSAYMMGIVWRLVLGQSMMGIILQPMISFQKVLF